MIDITTGPELRRFWVADGQQVALAQQTLELTRHVSAGVEPAVRKAWFRQIKGTYADTQWSKSLPYYW